MLSHVVSYSVDTLHQMFHRLVLVGRDSKDFLVQIHFHGQGHLLLDQVAQPDQSFAQSFSVILQWKKNSKE